MESKPVYRCCKCGDGIFDGDRYLDCSEGQVCELCLDEMIVDELVGLFGESIETAEKEEI